MKPVLKILKAIISGQINLQRCYGNIIVLYRIKIGTLACILGGARRPDPVDRSPMGIVRFHHRLRLVPESETADPYALEFVPRHVRDVDVEDELLG